ncbi:MAG: hypothetical protein ACTHMC_00120 [Pseudobacter sp.]|uniref:hypothetical protein n=1 Tax=Pseudobacter sp. TaxID=2045420 RepID=UPI003F81F7AC
MKKFSPFLFLILMLAVQPAISSGNLEPSGMQAVIFKTPEAKKEPVGSKYPEPRSGAVLARILVPDI